MLCLLHMEHVCELVVWFKNICCTGRTVQDVADGFSSKLPFVSILAGILLIKSVQLNYSKPSLYTFPFSYNIINSHLNFTVIFIYF